MAESTAPETPKDELAQLIDLASAKEAIKDYNAAADLYSQASELQAERNGDMAVENADVLYSYGKCLYHVGVNKSDVLGTKIPTQSTAKPTTAATEASSTEAEAPAPSSSSTKKPEESSVQNIIGQAMARGKEEQAEQGGAGAKLGEKQAVNKPHFQFQGDEAFDESDDEDAEGDDNEGGNRGGGEDEEDDDFANSFEILDLARVLYLRRLEELEAKGGEGKESDNTSTNEAELRRVKERLADTYDIQAEISLEGEKFTDAAADLRSSLKLKLELFSSEDALIAECHYKLSLALEFASITRRQNEEGQDEIAEVDYKLRGKAAEHMEQAIKSCKARIAREQAKITASTGEDTSIHRLKREVDEVKDIVSDMEQRLRELRQPPVSINPPEEQSGSSLLGKELSSQLNVNKIQELTELTKKANDLSGLVKRKKPAQGASTKETQKDSSKRPLEATDPVDEGPQQKKVHE